MSWTHFNLDGSVVVTRYDGAQLIIAAVPAVDNRPFWQRIFKPFAGGTVQRPMPEIDAMVVEFCGPAPAPALSPLEGLAVVLFQKGTLTAGEIQTATGVDVIALTKG